MLSSICLSYIEWVPRAFCTEFSYMQSISGSVRTRDRSNNGMRETMFGLSNHRTHQIPTILHDTVHTKHHLFLRLCPLFAHSIVHHIVLYINLVDPGLRDDLCTGLMCHPDLFPFLVLRDNIMASTPPTVKSRYTRTVHLQQSLGTRVDT